MLDSHENAAVEALCSNIGYATDYLNEVMSRGDLDEIKMALRIFYKAFINTKLGI